LNEHCCPYGCPCLCVSQVSRVFCSDHTCLLSTQLRKCYQHPFAAARRSHPDLDEQRGSSAYLDPYRRCAFARSTPDMDHAPQCHRASPPRYSVPVVYSRHGYPEGKHPHDEGLSRCRTSIVVNRGSFAIASAVPHKASAFVIMSRALFHALQN
jgi:hypothetical protein